MFKNIQKGLSILIIITSLSNCTTPGHVVPTASSPAKNDPMPFCQGDGQEILARPSSTAYFLALIGCFMRELECRAAETCPTRFDQHPKAKLISEKCHESDPAVKDHIGILTHDERTFATECLGLPLP